MKFKYEALEGSSDNWAQVVSGIGLIYYKLFFRPGPLSWARSSSNSDRGS